MRTYRKDRLDSRELVFDFTEYLAQIDDTIVVYTVLADLGVAVEKSILVDGKVYVTVGGGEYNTAYLIGVSALTSGETQHTIKARLIVQGVEVPTALDDPLILVDALTGPLFGDS